MILHIVRHGETVENQQRILQGHMPGTLTPLGLEQARKAAQALQGTGEPFDAIIASDLQRTVITAGIIGQALGMPVTTTPLLRERDWGECTGMPISEARLHYYNDGRWTFPASAETEGQILDRAAQVLHTLRQQYPADTRLVIVTHGQIARNIIAARFHCPTSEVTPLTNGEIRKLTI